MAGGPKSQKPSATNLTPLTTGDIIDIWKYTISVQMHFNDMEMKVRNLFFTIIAAMLGLIGVVQGRTVAVHIFGFELNISAIILILFSMMPISLLFYFIDRYWYHRLLVGAVKQCIEIENRYGAAMPDLLLGEKISKESPVSLPNWTKLLFFFVRDQRFRSDARLHSDGKIELLYKSVIAVACVLMIVFSSAGGITKKERPRVNCVIAQEAERIVAGCP